MKKGFSASDFHVSFADKSSSAFSLHSAFCCRCTHQKFFLSHFISLPGLAFLTLSLHHQTPSLYSPWSPKGQGCNPPFCFALLLLGSWAPPSHSFCSHSSPQLSHPLPVPPSLWIGCQGGSLTSPAPPSSLLGNHHQCTPRNFPLRVSTTLSQSTMRKIFCQDKYDDSE